MNLATVNAAFDAMFTEGETIHRKAWQSGRANFTRAEDFIMPNGSIDVTPLNLGRELVPHIDAHLPWNPVSQSDEE